MARNYDSTDLKWNWNGDFSLDESGDLSSNDTDFLESIEQEILTIVKSSKGDWKFHPNIGADLWRFKGEANTRENANKLKTEIKKAIVFSGIALESDVIVDVNAISLDMLYVSIFLKATPTLNNRLGNQNDLVKLKEYHQGIEVKFMFSTTTSAITF